MPRPLVRAAVAAVLAVAATAACARSPTPTPTPTTRPRPRPATATEDRHPLPVERRRGLHRPRAGRRGERGRTRDQRGRRGERRAVVVVNRDSGDASTQKVEESFADLVAQGVDVVIGPSSSVLSERLLAPAADADVPLVSPAATYPQLTTADDVGHLLPHDRVLPAPGVVLADLFAIATHPGRLVFRDDDLGPRSSRPSPSRWRAEGELEAVQVRADTDAAALAATVKEAEPDVVVLATPDNGDQTKALIARSRRRIRRGETLAHQPEPRRLLPSAAARACSTASTACSRAPQADAGFQARSSKRIRARRLPLRRGGVRRDGARGARGRARRRRRRRLDRTAPGVASVDGIKCTSFGECVDMLSTQTDIDYDGISGSTNLDAQGIRHAARTLSSYTAENKYRAQSGSPADRPGCAVRAK